jgi:signal transduction histidine kinase
VSRPKVEVARVSWATFSVREPAFANLRHATQTGLFVFVAYLTGAEAAFLLGTLSDKIFAPFWPPNVVLLAAMLLLGRQRIWLCIVAALPAHVIAEASVGMPALPMAVAFVTNVAVAAGSALVIWRFLGPPPWFDSFRKAVLYVNLVGFACPAVVAFAGAFVPMLVGARGSYDVFWLQWFSSNALGYLTLGPITLILVGQGFRAVWPATLVRQLEAIGLIVAIVAATHIAFATGVGRANNLFLPSLLYVPLPLILWFTARFGAAGASLSILAVTIDLIWRTLNGPSLFLEGTAETNVFALQVFMVCLAIPVLLLGASIDQTRNVERELREDEERIGLAAAAANVGFWQYDGAASQLWLSDYARVLFGFPEDGRTGVNRLVAAVHPEDVHLVRTILFEKEAAGAIQAVEFRVMLRDQTRWIMGRAQKPNGKAGPHSSGIFIDITARKNGEAEAEQQHREIAHLMRVNQVSELSGGIAHEITQPLTAIMANAQAARVMLDSPRMDLAVIAEVLDDIIEEDQRAGDVINRVRSLLKDRQITFEPVDANELVTSTLRLLHSELINRRVRVEPKLDIGLPTVQADPIQLQQVLINLVTNAIEAVHQMDTPRRVIMVRTRFGADNMVEICVVDRGIGIDADRQKRIFEPFFTTKDHGLGLGLSICSTIMGRHDGTLSVVSNPSGGASACVRLPVKGR